VFFDIEELNTPREGTHTKNDRISRLEPDFNRGIFYLPAVIYHPEYGGGLGNQALWDIWQDAKTSSGWKTPAPRTTRPSAPSSTGRCRA
jgi:hypothetical protein